MAAPPTHFSEPRARCRFWTAAALNAGPPDHIIGARGRWPFSSSGALEGGPSSGRPIHPAHGTLWAPRDGRKQHTTYAKTGHTVPEKPVAKLPLERTE